MEEPEKESVEVPISESLQEEAPQSVNDVDQEENGGSVQENEDDALSAPQEESSSSPRFDRDEIRTRTRKRCCPYGIERHSIPLAFAVLAYALTFTASWWCAYFVGATTGFTGKNYGLWTTEDLNGDCQTWDTLFYSYSLGPYLVTARAFSMTAMVLGLSLVTAMSQALQCHIVSWALGLAFGLFFIVSLATAQRFNIWSFFFLFLYIVLVLIVRALFIHPVHRVISTRGSRYIALDLLFVFLMTILTLLVLKSDFCQCENLTNDRLEGRLDPDQDPCRIRCQLGPAGVMMVFGAASWLFASLAVFKYGVQPEGFDGEETTRFAGYSRDSVTTKAIKAANKAMEGVKQTPHNVKEKTQKYAKKLSSQDSSASAAQDDPLAVTVEVTEGSNQNGNDALPSEGNNTDDHDDYGAYQSEANDSDDGSAEFRRTCCQRLCCDFRVKPRSRKEKFGFWCFRIGLGAAVAIFVVVFIMLVGSKEENNAAEAAPSTTPSFVTNVSCAFNPLNPTAPFVTYNTSEAAVADGMVVAHCGACAHCSNMEDIRTYVTTRETITIQAKKCGPKAVLGSTSDLDKCLEDRIGFTPQCRRCWVENMQCDTQKCLFTCMKTLFTGFLAHNNVPQSGDQGRLNWCLQCDERRCGTAFVTCSGSARRRLGIQSAIERNPAEICPWVDFDWEKFDFPPTPQPSGANTIYSLPALMAAALGVALMLVLSP